VVGLSQNISIQ